MNVRIFYSKMWDLGKNFKRQLPNQVHAVLGVGVFTKFCLPNSYLFDIN